MYLIDDVIITYDKVLNLLKERFKDSFEEDGFLTYYQEYNFEKKISNNGIIAGQAVSSVIFELLNLKRLVPVYNDIDYFLPTTVDKMHYHKKQYGNIENGISNYELFNNEKEDEEYKNGFKKYSYKERNVYKILGTQRIEDLNKIYIYINNIDDEGFKNFSLKLKTMQKSFQDFLSGFVETFDINSTKCGINLRTKEIYLSPDFIDFVKTFELKITNSVLPYHSAIRYLTKKKELNCYGNDDYELGKIATILGFNREFMKSKKENSLPSIKRDFFNREFMKFGLKYKDKLRYLSYNQFFDCQLADKKSEEDFDYYYLDGNNEDMRQILETKFKDYVLFDERHNNPFGYSNTISGLLDFDKFSSENIKKYFYNEEKKQRIKDLGYSNKPWKMTKILDNKKYNRIIKTIKQHEELNFIKSSNLDPEEMLNLFELLFKLEKKYSSIIYSYMDRYKNNLKFILENKYKFVKKFISYLTKDYESLKDREIESCEKDNVFRIDEIVDNITLKLEGSTMSHCVGGYEGKIQRRECIILKTYPLNDNNNYRSTVELYRVKLDYDSKNDLFEYYKSISSSEFEWSEFVKKCGLYLNNQNNVEITKLFKDSQIRGKRNKNIVSECIEDIKETLKVKNNITIINRTTLTLADLKFSEEYECNDYLSNVLTKIKSCEKEDYKPSNLKSVKSFCCDEDDDFDF